MRLEPSAEFMYRRMDQKDRVQILIPVCGIFASLGFFVTAFPKLYLSGISMIIGFLAAMLLCLGLYRNLKRKIMPVSGCFLEIQSKCFVVAQPYLDNTYETCRVYYDEIENLVRMKNGNGFYLKVNGEGKSIIKGKQKGKRRTMLIRSSGYSKENMDAFYKTIAARLPDTARVYEYERR